MMYIIAFAALAVAAIVGLILFGQRKMDPAVRVEPQDQNAGFGSKGNIATVIAMMIVAILAGFGLKWAIERRRRLAAAQCRR